MSQPTITRVPTEKMTPLGRVVPQRIVDATLLELRARSAGWRESAAIWAGDRNGVVRQVFFHHHLGNDRAGPQFLELSEAAKLQLYQRLAGLRQVLLALLHTHPYAWVGLSAIDQQNQISSQVGFWSIVIPHFGQRAWDTRQIGFHVRAERGWKRLSPCDVQRRFQIKGD